MTRLRALLRRLALHSLLVVAAWLALLLVAALGGDALNAIKTAWPKRDARIDLPNYADKAKARVLFDGFKRTVEDYVPFVVWRRLPLATPYVNIGPDGLRLHTAGRDNDRRDARTIGFFGGSTMWGTGVADDETIPAYFDVLTEGYRVTNYGEGGHTDRQQLAQLLNLINTGTMPDTVVFYGGFNHVWTHCNAAVTESLNGHMAEAKLRRALTERPLGGYFWADIVAPPLGFVRRLVGEKRFVVNRYVCHDDPSRAEAVADTLLRTWRAAEVLVTGHGGRFYAFLQPVAYLGRPYLDHLTLGRELAAEQFQTTYSVLRERLAGGDFPYVHDLGDAFDGDVPLYIDDAHVTAPGNEIVARRMLAVVGRP